MFLACLFVGVGVAMPVIDIPVAMATRVADVQQGAHAILIKIGAVGDAKLSDVQIFLAVDKGEWLSGGTLEAVLATTGDASSRILGMTIDPLALNASTTIAELLQRTPPRSSIPALDINLLICLKHIRRSLVPG